MSATPFTTAMPAATEKPAVKPFIMPKSFAMGTPCHGEIMNRRDYNGLTGENLVVFWSTRSTNAHRNPPRPSTTRWKLTP